MSAVTVVDVFNRSAEAQVFEGAYDGVDGFACPFCSSVSLRRAQWPRCENPWCPAAALPGDPRAEAIRQAFIDHAHDAGLREQEDRWRKATSEWAARYHQEQRDAEDQARRDAIEQARKAGQCLRCAADRYRPRFIKHRAGHAHLQ